MLLLALTVGTLGPQPLVRAALCPSARTTIEVDACLSAAVAKARMVLDRYRTAARRIAADGDNPAVLAAFDAGDRAWRTYEQASCNAVYVRWQGGTIRGAVFARCELRLIRLQMHTLWQDWLTYPDNTPSILPEPIVETGV